MESVRLFFIVHYADGRTMKGTTKEGWMACPENGVLVITEVYNRVYKGRYACQRHAGCDYYWWDDGAIGAGSAKSIPSAAIIKRGKEVDTETWNRLYNLACIDPMVDSEV